MFLYPVQTRVHAPDLSRFPFLWFPEHVLCASAVLGDGQLSFLSYKTQFSYTFLGSKRKNTLITIVFEPPDACTRTVCMHRHLVHAQDSCACTRILCMHTISVHAQDFCPLHFNMNLTDLSVELH